MIYKPYDLVAVPFPFTDKNVKKRRPALVLSSYENFNYHTGHSLLAMITSAKNSRWELDVEIENLENTGLHSASIIRMKLFTLDSRLIIKKLGTLSDKDQKKIKKNLKKLIIID